MKTIGERIVFLREKYNITQKTLAKDVNITEASLSRYENNLREPKAEIVANLAVRLNTTADFLLGCSNSPRLSNSNEDNALLQDIQSLSAESKAELNKYVNLLKIRDSAATGKAKK